MERFALVPTVAVAETEAAGTTVGPDGYAPTVATKVIATAGMSAVFRPVVEPPAMDTDGTGVLADFRPFVGEPARETDATGVLANFLAPGVVAENVEPATDAADVLRAV